MLRLNIFDIVKVLIIVVKIFWLYIFYQGIINDLRFFNIVLIVESEIICGDYP